MRGSTCSSAGIAVTPGRPAQCWRNGPHNPNGIRIGWRHAAHRSAPVRTLAMRSAMKRPSGMRKISAQDSTCRSFAPPVGFRPPYNRTAAQSDTIEIQRTSEIPAAGIILPFRPARKPIMPTTDDGSLTPASNLDHSLAAIFAGEQSDQCLRRILQPIDDVFLDLELAGGDP